MFYERSFDQQGGNKESLEGAERTGQLLMFYGDQRASSLPTRGALSSTGKVIFTQSGHYHTVLDYWIIRLCLAMSCQVRQRVRVLLIVGVIYFSYFSLSQQDTAIFFGHPVSEVHLLH